MPAAERRRLKQAEAAAAAGSTSGAAAGSVSGAAAETGVTGTAAPTIVLPPPATAPEVGAGDDSDATEEEEEAAAISAARPNAPLSVSEQEPRQKQQSLDVLLPEHALRASRLERAVAEVDLLASSRKRGYSTGEEEEGEDPKQRKLAF